MRSRIRPTFDHATVVAYLALFLALTSGAWAMSAHQTKTKKPAARTLVACVARSGGAVRLVTSRKACHRSERSVSWNRSGIAGAVGPVGPVGATGPSGTPDVSRFYSRTEADARYLPAARFGGADHE